MKKIIMFFCGAIISCFSFGQNVGIGKNNPQVRLDVLSSSNSPARFDGTSPMFIGLYEDGLYRGYLGSFSGAANDVDFGTGFGNSSGKLHLTIQTSPRLTIRENGYVGINTTNPQWDLDVEGSLRFNGRLYVNGSSGVSGQVLTSNGLGVPSWQTLSSAYSDNIRFSYTGFNNTLSAGDLSLGMRYNTNPSSISHSGTRLTINKTGIYHFEGTIRGTLDYIFNPLPSVTPSISLNFYVYGGVGLGNNEIISDDLVRNASSIGRYSRALPFSADFYLTAGQQIAFGFNYNTSAYGGIDTFMYMRGFFISE